MDRTCIIHIGTTKTGSTAIQKALGTARRHLREVGIEYPTPAHYTLAPSFFGLLDKSDPGLDGLTMERLEATLNATKADFVVLSNESLSHPQIQRAKVHEFLGRILACGFRPVVVAFVRPQPGLLNSEYVQMIQGLRKAASFDHYFQARRRSPHYRWTGRLQHWASYPDATFVALPYNHLFRHPDIAGRMLRAVGVPAERVQVAALPALPPVNQSFGTMAVAAARYVQPRLVEAGLALNGRLRAIVRQKLDERGWNADRFSGFDDATAEAFAEAFDEDNDAFAATYWHGSTWRKHFPADYAAAWERNEIDLATLSPALRQRFDFFAADVIAAATTPRAEAIPM